MSELKKPIVDFPSELIETLINFEESTVYVQVIELNEMILPDELGFGFLVPTIEDEDLLGVIYDSCSMPEHDKNGSRYTIMSKKPVDSIKAMGYNSFIKNFCILH